MLAATLSTKGLPAPVEGLSESNGRYTLCASACTVDPFSGHNRGPQEKTSLKRTEISKMKGQGLVCARNATLMAVNLRYITYAMKEGTVRVISQNGKDMFKISNTTKAPIIDMTILGAGGVAKDRGQASSFLVCLDSAARACIYELETKRKVEVVFPAEDPPQFVIAHPSEPDLFATVGKATVTLWSLTKLLEAPCAKPQGVAERESDDCSFRVVDNDLLSSASFQATLPSNLSALASAEADANIRDVAISVNGDFLIALFQEYLVTWRLTPLPVASMGMVGQLELVQILSLADDVAFKNGVSSIRILGNGGTQRHGGTPVDGSNEVLVLSSSTSSVNLWVYEFCATAAAPMGSLLQSIHINTKSARSGDLVSLNVNSITQDTLALAFHDEGIVLALPLAAGWSQGPHCPFPFVQHLDIDEAAHQLSAMTGKSFTTSGHTLFVYRAHNFTREKDGLTGCNIVVDEVQSSLVARSEAVAVTPTAAGAEDTIRPAVANVSLAAAADVADVPRGEAETSHDVDSEEVDVARGPGAASEPRAHAVEPQPEVKAQAEASSQGAADEPPKEITPGRPERDKSGKGIGAAHSEPAVQARVVRTQAADSEGEAAFGDSEAKKEDAKKDAELGDAADRGCDWGLLKQCAASFVKSLEKRRGEMSDRILGEVTDALKASGVSQGGDKEMIDQAVAKVREAREVQAAGEKSLAAAVRKATDTWFEASSVTVATVLQKELGKISEGVAASLAQQLSQSRRFCEALAKGVNVKSGVVTKQALENLRPPKQLQETVGTALTEALHESLGPVFHTELRAHLEEELCPLIEQRVVEMMSSLRDKMGECLDGIAEQHEQAAQRLGRDLAPVIAKELRDAERLMAQRCAGGSSPNQSGGLAESQVEELARCMQTEVVAPLHARIRELTSQVQTMREEAAQLERQWRSIDLSGQVSRPGEDSSGSGVPATALRSGVAPRPLDEEAQVKELERLFREALPEDAFVKAMKLQETAKHVDFLGRACALVPGSAEDWLDPEAGGCPLSMPVKMQLMLALARQLLGKGFSKTDKDAKVKWIEELWFAFDLADSSVAASAATHCGQLTELLENAAGNEGFADELRQIIRSLKTAVRVNGP